MDALTILRDTVAAHGDGLSGTINPAALPAGWAQVTYFPPRDSELNEFFGPVVLERSDVIVLNVAGSERVFTKAKVIITRP